MTEMVTFLLGVLAGFLAGQVFRITKRVKRDGYDQVVPDDEDAK